MVQYIFGRVSELESGRPVAGVTVEAYDADVFGDDLLGTAQTDEEGHYVVETKARMGLVRERPDPYVMLKDGQGRLLKSTRASRLRGIEKDAVIDVPISCYRLAESGLIHKANLPPELREPPAPELSRWILPLPKADPVFANIALDLRGKASLLELLAHYMRSLRQSPDDQAPAFVKLAKLFALGLAPMEVTGHCYGVTLGLRTLGQDSAWSQIDNVIGLLWGAALADDSPWVGKSFERVGAARAEGLLGTQPPLDRPAFLGTNHFTRLESRPASNVSYYALGHWLGLQDAVPDQRAAYGHERDGGNFLACQAPSVWAGSQREVFALNYRLTSMHNRPPLSWLVDELVQIGEGLYLGQLLFATRGLLSSFDPRWPAHHHGYNHMGYFALWDERWNGEARRLFPFLEIPMAAPRPRPPSPIVVGDADGFRALKCETPPPAICDGQVFAEVEADLARCGSVLHLLKVYSDELQRRQGDTSAPFRRLQELFNRGRPVQELSGFYRGALVSWHGEGLFKLLATNLLDRVWAHAASWSTWTGKRFDGLAGEELARLSEGFERAVLPTAWGANTHVLRSLRQKQLGKAMELAGVGGERASEEEARRDGYDLRSLFFIAHEALALHPDNRGKHVYQCNYRWPKLEAAVPDCYRMDELVEIAEGLFLGQLLYATDWLLPYDPTRAPADYAYGQFGYFLLMTEAWHSLRLRLGFDLENV